MAVDTQIDAWRQRLNEIRMRLNRAETLSLSERESLKSQHLEIERLLQLLQRS